MVEYYAQSGANYNCWHCDPTNSSPHNYAVREILSLMKETGARTLLDVCCGTGRALKSALDRGYDGQGIDVSPQLLEIARDEIGIPEENLTLGDATSLPFADQSFDICCVLGALHHTAQPETIISEMVRVCRLGIVVSDEGNHGWGGMK